MDLHIVLNVFILHICHLTGNNYLLSKFPILHIVCNRNAKYVKSDSEVLKIAEYYGYHQCPSQTT
jgi:hypothetical protein